MLYETMMIISVFFSFLTNERTKKTDYVEVEYAKFDDDDDGFDGNK